MSKVAFLASFLATFMTMDAYWLDGSATRFVWRETGDVAKAAQISIMRWAHPIMRRYY